MASSSKKVKKGSLKEKSEVKKTGKERKSKGSSSKSERGKGKDAKGKAAESKASKRKMIEETKAKSTKTKRTKEETKKKPKQEKVQREVAEEKRVPALRDSKAPAAPSRRVSVKSAVQKQEFRPDDPPAALKAATLCTPPTRTPLVTPSPSPPGSTASLRELKDLSKKKGVSLEDLMQEQSEKLLDEAVESHMKKLMDEQKKQEKKDDGAKDDESEQAEGSEDEVEDPKEDEKPSAQSDLEEESQESPSSMPSSDSEPEASESEQEEDMNEPKDEKNDDDQEMSESDEESNESEESRAEKEVETLMGPPEASPSVPVEKQQKAEKAASAQVESFATANSATHKQLYDKFCRQCCDRKKFPVSLAQHCVRDELDLFRTWLEMNGDWNKVEVTIQRKAENKTKATKMRSGTKLRDILKLYPEKKAMALVKKLKDKGMYHFDEDFPGDEEEIFYYVGGGNTLKNENITTTSAKVEIKDTNNKDLTNALICEGGALQSGALPSLEGASDSGSKAVLEAVSSAATTQVKAKLPKDKDAAKKAEPKTLLEKASDVMDDVLRKGADARKHSISLQTVEYSGDLCQKMMDFSAKMEKIYNHLRDLVVKKASDPAMFEKHFQIVHEKFQWFEKAEAAAKALKSGMNPKPKKKAKVKKEHDGPGEQVVPAE